MLTRIMMMTVVMLVRDVKCSMSGNNENYFHNSYQVEDNCQFQLCGSKYSHEFGLDSSPIAGSCSGDCHLLSLNLATGKFQKEFLWSNCARMCQTKYPFHQYSEYKPRFLCMETCYNSYNKIAPHHDLARYCLQASCPDKSVADMSQLECFEQCTSHVVTSVPQEDWKTWARSLAGDCQASPDLTPDTPTSPAHRLTCADSHLWLTMSKIVNLSDQVGRKCLNTICNDNVKCGKQCLKHVDKMEHVHRSVWTECSESALCSSSSFNQRLRCSDTCLEEHLENRRKKEQEERIRRQQEQE